MSGGRVLMTGLGLLLSLALLLVSGRARAAATCTRPTDAEGYSGYAYGSATPLHFDAPDIRVWYVMDGPHRVNAKSTRSDGVPDDVARTAEVTEGALARYASMGYRMPLPDDDATCGSNGGDPRLDVYLVDFTAADGTTVPERCTKVGGVNRCASFILAESDFAGRYASADEGIRTVLPHEAFHAVQNAYDADMDRFWAEGTAQWAAKMLSPELRDLERFLPAFFRDPSRSLDLPPGGVTAAYLYGAAIWPIYLTETRGDDIVLSILETESVDGSPALNAADAVLRAANGSSLAAEFTRFAVWNTATGTRAMNAGYRSAKDYPMLDLVNFPRDGLHGATSGLASFYYRLELDSEQQLTLDADPARTSATLVPLDGAAARIDHATRLTPGSGASVRVHGASIVVISGTTTNKLDAPFALTLSAPPPQDPPASDPPASHDPANVPSTSPPNAASGGCSLAPSTSGERRGGGTPTWAILVGLALFLGACTRASPGSSHTEDAAIPPRIVSVGGPVTETLFALGAGDQVVGVDTSSVYPEKATQLPHVGYQRTVAAEGILGLTPNLVLAAEEAGPPVALEQIRSTGVRLEIFPSDPTLANARSRIEKIAKIVNRDPTRALADFDADVAKATALVAKSTSHPKVLALYARGQNLIHVFGTHSAADSMLRLAGAINAVTAFEGSKPMSPEAMIQAAPDVILVPSRGLESLGGLDGLANVGGIAQTPAGKARRIVAVDDLLLLGFGPRTGQALRELARKIHPELSAEVD